ncbi:hypothetical protein [Nocardia amikacinitolerans]|uniref:hypothetical protein n=1 Tax=Nocardia amikacinitolerans TaxID=756689 RepID=UPI0012EECFBA|nr:hypothetical protein [Nocardia amikacinitolerans]
MPVEDPPEFDALVREFHRKRFARRQVRQRFEVLHLRRVLTNGQYTAEELDHHLHNLERRSRMEFQRTTLRLITQCFPRVRHTDLAHSNLRIQAVHDRPLMAATHLYSSVTIFMPPQRMNQGSINPSAART